MSNQTTTLPAHRSDPPAFEPAATPPAPAAPQGHSAGSATPRPAAPAVHGVAARTIRPGSAPPSSACSAATALLYLWGLGASGWANSFYSAAVQAGSQSWKAFFFGSSDAANFITVDKTPAVAVGDGALGHGSSA